ncbi:MAG TPA: MBL fold metallo-hydrolase [Sphingomicrobium sp.]|nr:MBL fold metallo-hydrolase [Sphingomicrobium sp.]
MRSALTALFLLLLAGAAQAAEPYHLIPGAVPLDSGPDGNTIVLDAPKGLIVFDTGRHPEHARKILDYAKGRGRPIAAVINSHWHLDHSTGNWDIRKAHPRVEIYASNAIQGALATFLKQSRASTDKMLADPKTPAAVRDQLLRGRAVIDHPERIRPNRLISKSGRMRIAGRALDVHLVKFAATEGDVWIFDPRTKTAIVGDLVVDIVPFMDTACPDGWSKALGEVAKAPFTRLVPGHGPVMSRADFAAWRKAYDNFVDCGHSDAAKEKCVDGWLRDAAKFIDAAHKDYARESADYYLTTRLRSSAEEQQKYCKPLRA